MQHMLHILDLATDMQPLPIRLLLPTVLPMLRLMLQSMFRGDGSAFEPPPHVFDHYDFVIGKDLLLSLRRRPLGSDVGRTAGATKASEKVLSSTFDVMRRNHYTE